MELLKLRRDNKKLVGPMITLGGHDEHGKQRV